MRQSTGRRYATRFNLFARSSSTVGMQSSAPSPLRFGPLRRRPVSRRAAPLSARRQSHVHESGCAKRRARLLGQRVRPHFPIAECFRGAAQRAVEHRARVSVSVRRDARDDEPASAVPHPRGTSRYRNADALPVVGHALHGEHASVQVGQVSVPRSYLAHGGTDRDRLKPHHSALHRQPRRRRVRPLARAFRPCSKR